MKISKAKLNYSRGSDDKKETKTDFILLDKQIPLSEHQIPDEILYSDLKEDAYLMRVYQELNGGRGSYGQIHAEKSIQVSIIDYLIKNGFKLLINNGMNWHESSVFLEGEINDSFFFEKSGHLIVSTPLYLYTCYERANPTQTQFLRELIAFTKEGEIKDGKNRVYLIMDDHGLYLEPFDLAPTKIDFDNYNDDFKEKYEDVVEFLHEGSAGLVLLSGKPGTGKSSLLKAISAETDRKMVYMPPEAIAMLSLPSFQSFAKRELSGAVLFIEDCERCLLAGPNGERTAETTALLNISDGILGDILNLAILGTYNLSDENSGNIDPALLRKGRLRKHISFEELPVDRAQKLVDKLGKTFRVTEAMTLGDVFNLEADTGIKKKIRPRVGF